MKYGSILVHEPVSTIKFVRDKSLTSRGVCCFEGRGVKKITQNLHSHDDKNRTNNAKMHIDIRQRLVRATNRFSCC